MPLPIALNIAWGLIAFAAVLLFALSERWSLCVRRRGKARRWMAVLLAICFLFPCVSASDDILGLSTLRHGKERSPAPSKLALQLDRILQGLENLQVASAFTLFLTLCCVGLVFVSEFRNVARQIPCLIGRGPPASA